MKSSFTGQTMIFANEYNGRTLYKTSIGKKDKNGEWENASILVNFPKDTQIANKTTVDMKDAWLSFYYGKDRDGNVSKIPQWYIVCTEFEVLDAPEAVEGFTAMTDDEIPF